MKTKGLKEVRLNQFMTQEELAEKTGLSFMTIHRLETGHSARMRTIRRIAEALGVAPADLVEEQSQ